MKHLQFFFTVRRSTKFKCPLYDVYLLLLSTRDGAMAHQCADSVALKPTDCTMALSLKNYFVLYVTMTVLLSNTKNMIYCI